MRALVVTVGVADVELASDALWSLGVVAVEERATDADSTVELWTSLGEDADAIGDALSAVPWPWRFEVIDASVSDTWREHVMPTWVTDDVVVHPSWRERSSFPGGGDFGTALAIGIDPGATFGMGDHPTTVLSMRTLRDLVHGGESVLDVGCGSGVLAIAACLFGARRAVGTDISTAAVPTTLHNAAWNGVAERIEVSTTPLAEIDGPYDIVVANILAPVLIDLAADLVRVVGERGHLIISGILAERHDHVLAALAPLRQTDRRDLDGWTAITLER